MLSGSDGAKRLECAGLPALSDGLGAGKSGSKLPHSKRFALAAAQPIVIVCGAACGIVSDLQAA
jgi:hypothetical protein